MGGFTGNPVVIQLLRLMSFTGKKFHTEEPHGSYSPCGHVGSILVRKASRVMELNAVFCIQCHQPARVTKQDCRQVTKAYGFSPHLRCIRLEITKDYKPVILKWELYDSLLSWRNNAKYGIKDTQRYFSQSISKDNCMPTKPLWTVQKFIYTLLRCKYWPSRVKFHHPQSIGLHLTGFRVIIYNKDFLLFREWPK